MKNVTIGVPERIKSAMLLESGEKIDITVENGKTTLTLSPWSIHTFVVLGF